MFRDHHFLHVTKKSRNIAVLFGLVTIIEGILWYFMPIYFESKLNNLFLVSVVISAQPVASLLSGLPAGDICDKIGRKFGFILGLVGFIASFIFLFMGDFYSLVIFMLCYGAFSTLYGVSAFIGVLDGSKIKFTGQSAGFYTSLQYAGWLFGSLAGGVLILALEPPFMIQILTLTLALIFSASIFVFPGKTNLNFRQVINSEKILLQDRLVIGEIRAIKKFGRPLIAILAFSFVFGYWEFAIWTFEPIYANSIGSGLLVGALILGMISLPGAVSSLAAGKMLDRIGPRRFIPIGVVSIILGQLVFLAHQSLLTLAVALVLTSTGAIFISIFTDYYIKKHVEKKLQGEVDGAVDTLYNIGGVLGPLTIGIALTVGTLANIFYFTFALFLLAIMTLFFVKDVQ